MSEAASRLALRLAEEWSAGRTTSVTWLNHCSAMKVLRANELRLTHFDYVGLDGLLLLLLLGSGSEERTSADLVVPRALPLLAGARVALVGGARDRVERAADVLARRYLARSGGTVVDVRDGYGEVPRDDAVGRWLQCCRPDVILVGLGAVRQESWALAVRERLPAGLIMTCGGFFDQIGRDRPYYPGWAYPLRLNWAVRLAREPRRLWGRYTLEAVRAVAERQTLRQVVLSLPGFTAHRAAVHRPRDRDGGTPAPSLLTASSSGRGSPA